MFSRKGNFLIVTLIVLTLFLTIFVSYFRWRYQPMQWKPYSNSTIGISFQLPLSWFYHPEIKMPYGYQLTVSYPVDNPSPQSPVSGQTVNFGIGVSTNSQSQTLEQITRQSLSNPGSNLSRSGETRIDGEKAVILSTSDGLYRIVIANHGDSTYKFSLGVDKEVASSVAPIFNQILASVKFLNPVVVTTPAGTFNDGRVSFKYPTIWKIAKQENLADQGYVWIESPDNIYKLTYGWNKNINNQTGQPYTDILEFLNYPPSPLPPKGVETVYVAGQVAAKLDLHSENFGTSDEVNLTSVHFFSPDKSKIYSLEMQINASDWGEIRTGTDTLDQVASSFKFVK